MELADLQLWFGLLMLFSGFIVYRMGPSFRRSIFGKPMIVMGVVLTLIHFEDLSTSENLLHAEMMLNSPWIVLAFIGILMSLFGAPVYWKRNLNANIFGVLLISISWIIYFYSVFSFNINDALNSLFNLLGMFFALISIAYMIKIIESKTPKVQQSEPLTKNEKKFITSILKRNMGGK
jgi:hypothetical protein